MDTMLAFARAEAATRAGNKPKVFDWDKAARLIKERNAQEASAGLSGDWECTGGTIFANGKPVKKEYTFLGSIWATPEIEIDGELIECWVWEDDSPGWNSGTKWPQSALDILKEEQADGRH